ncbi:hypothetical protein [Nannocystis punicea]|uniref:Anti-sigma-K factor rskA n=1 Tax=Nannocystis punicea TaxID=2995304 RepID=A0ABY7GRQ5_9BACT|nr:hypothetical protein [Nannocystis poenicansa]WAS89596.1 hypothetical protein O0S08_25660 [Nannocystis poenicansa]
MTEPLDPLLRALGELERDLDRRHPGEWEDALAGRRDPADVAAARAALDPADEHAAFTDMFSKPASEADLEALLDRAAAVLAGPADDMSQGTATALPALSGDMSPGTARPTSADLAREPGADVAASQPRAPGSGVAPAEASAPGPVTVLPLAGRRRAITLAGIVLAVAAAALLWRFTAGVPQAPLTGYTVTVRNQTLQELRGDEPSADLARYRPDSEIDWVLSPEQTTAAAVDLRVLARAPDGRTQLFAPPFTRSAAGALRIRGRLDAALPLAPGRWRLSLLVSPAGQAPRTADDVAPAVSAGHAVEVAPPLELEIVPVDP